ncbi:MAG: tRNA (adenosine(37)-N6)-threonylcarbamoyltransferase complex ATPase subunit type 1 TsaE [Bacteroidales bacterium]|nr:tRNA (adenosine(37)-N6)-threonylcarbamoyltransferase complex ATPase subunit type 1 TsaE [Bacteroidales bacterium]MCF8390534.1 tRNA (adenosine(37)-N6)-threonylcarbamoyltransferase complex ATPase subunit type 1 TsaE [Bacteroidales bacterium]
MHEILIINEGQLGKAAKEFVEKINTSTVFAFYGEMGAGKTTFIKAICRELGVTDNISSPTFALVYEYSSERRGLIYHFDLYRVKSIVELYDLGYEDYFFGGNLCFIEWPEMAGELLPEDVKKVFITVNQDGSRTVSL